MPEQTLSRRFIIGSFFAIVLAAATVVYFVNNYTVINGKVVNDDEIRFASIEDQFRDAYLIGDVDGQIAVAEELQKNANDPDVATLYLAEAYLNKGSMHFDEEVYADKALALLNPLLEKNPNNSDVLSAVGYAYEIKEEYSLAISYYDRAIEIDNSNDLAFTRRGHAKDLMGDIPEAELDYLRAYELDPDRDVTLMNLARLYYRIAEDDLAVEYADAAIDVSDTAYVRATAAELIGLIAIDTDEYDLAKEYFDFAISEDPEYAGAYEQRAYVMLVAAEVESGATEQTKDAAAREAFTYLDEALKLNPSSSYAYAVRGLAFELLQDTEPALAEYNKALSLIDEDITLGANEKEDMRTTINLLLEA